MHRRISLMLSATMMVALTKHASAEPVYTYITDATTYTANPGSSVQVHVFLQETLGAGDTSVIASDGGLLGAGFDVQVAPNQTNAGSLTAITGDSNSFSGGFSTDPLNSSTNLRGDNIVFASATSGPSPTMGLLSIGYVTIAPSAVVGATTQFYLGAYQPGGNGYTNTFNNLYNIDLTNTNPAYIGTAGTLANPIAYDETFSVTTVVPEPLSVASAVGGMVLLAGRRRRCRNSN